MRREETVGQEVCETHSALMNGTCGEVLAHLATGMTDAAVARRLALCERTVQRHVCRAMNLLNVQSRLELGIELTRRGLI